MPDQYEFALTQNNEAGLTRVSIQPKSTGLMPFQRLYGADLHGYDDGNFSTHWIYTGTLLDVDYQNLLMELGVSLVESVDCTIRTPDSQRYWQNYNAILHQPINGQTAKFAMGFWSDVIFKIVIIEAL